MLAETEVRYLCKYSFSKYSREYDFLIDYDDPDTLSTIRRLTLKWNSNGKFTLYFRYLCRGDYIVYHGSFKEALKYASKFTLQKYNRIFVPCKHIRGKRAVNCGYK